MLKRQGQAREARQTLEAAIRLNPNSEPIQRLLLEVYDDVQAQKEDPSLRFVMGQLAMKLKEYDRAVGCFQKARLDPGIEQQATRFLAECFIHKGLYDLALEEFQNIPVDADTKSLLYRIGLELENRRNLTGARQAYQRIYAVDVDFLDVADRLNKVSSVSGTSSTAFLTTSHEKNIIFAELSESAKHRYDNLEEIGRGSMGVVYRAHDNELDETVALKILPENMSKNPEAVRRFRQEARNARRLAHENIVRIHDIGEEQGRKYISMEYVQGSTLKNFLRESRLAPPIDVLLSFARQIAVAMAYAHSAGIIHRDLKPANIIITEEGIVKVMDFGIAKAMEIPQQTLAGAIVGTPLYMSPEQVMGESLDHRADIYSFGVMLYEMVSGHPPFREGDLAYQHVHVEPSPLEDVEPQIAELVMKCLKKKASDRWNNFGEIVEQLDRIQSGK